jgi:DNA-binding GntR family transcriptional regulator
MTSVSNGSTTKGGLVADLAADRTNLSRTSTAERIVDILRARIAEGYFPPGTRLSEDSLGEALGVSRNTLREAFRLLTHERLLEHQLNRGVFVRHLSVDDVIDVYRARGLIETAALDAAKTPLELGDVRAAVEDGEAAARNGEWQTVGTANIRFHQAIVGLADSARLNEFMRGLLAELRLVFHVVDDPKRLHEPYVPRNRALLTTLEHGDLTAAQQELAGYLDEASNELIDATRSGPSR